MQCSRDVLALQGSRDVDSVGWETYKDPQGCTTRLALRYQYHVPWDFDYGGFPTNRGSTRSIGMVA